MNAWLTDVDVTDGLEFFDDNESIAEDIAAQVGRRTGWSSRVCGVVECEAQAKLVESFTEIGEAKKTAAELQAIKDRIEEGRDVFRKVFDSRKTSVERQAAFRLHMQKERDRQFGVFCTFKDDPLFLKNWGCLIKFLPEINSLHVIGMKTMGVLGSGVRELSEGRNFQVHSIPPIFHKFHHVDSFYQSEEDAKLLLADCQASVLSCLQSGKPDTNPGETNE